MSQDSNGESVECVSVFIGNPSGSHDGSIHSVIQRLLFIQSVDFDSR